jgi:uncharacterized membrane protein (UPF0127 family)
MNNSLTDWNSMIHQLERSFNKHYWNGNMVLAHEITMVYIKLLTVVKLTFPEYRHR